MNSMHITAKYFAEMPMLWGNKVCYSCTGEATLKTSVRQLLLIPFFFVFTFAGH